MESVKQEIADLLEQSIGLTVDSIGSSTFQRALNSRKKALGLVDDWAYLEKLKVSYMELRRLVEEVVIPETWFFRDQEPFNYLTEYVLRSTRDFSVDILRILSLPCSTGEEPYSIAMTLLQAGLKPSSFFIDGVDVSNRSLTTAKTGVYKQNSFRTKDLEFRDSFFDRVEQGFSLKNIVREKVRFLQGNILQPAFLESLGRYSVVFCRNLLIYFNKESQQQAIRAIYQLLVPGGLLFAGHSEAGLFMGSMFSPVPHSRAFAFIRKDMKEENVWVPPAQVEEIVKEATRKSVLKFRPKRVERTVDKIKVSASSEVDEYARAQFLADKGDLGEAKNLCQQYIHLKGPSAKWYYLLGIITDSQGKPEEAKKYFRKAVYLDPANADSLIQLSLLAERSGNLESAANYKRRARRIQEKG